MSLRILNLRKKIEKSKHHEKFNSSSVKLDKLLDCQRSPFDKSGLGFRKVEDNLEEDKWSPKTPNAGPSMTKDASYVPAHDNKDGECSRTHQEADLIPQSKDSTPRRKQGPRYEYEFNGYCFSCSNFGHKAMNCGSRNIRRQSNSVRCWTCKQEGHIAATCHTLRCYMCSGFGLKAHECASQRSQPRSSSYTSARITGEPWKKTNP